MPDRDLVERLEGAKAGSRELDAELCILFQYGGPYSEGATNVRVDLEWGDDDLLYEIGDDECCCPVPPVTTSIDAALSLAGRVLPGWRMHALQDQDGMYQTDNTATRWFCGVSEKRGPGNVMSKAATPALALCAAILRARQPENAGGEG